MKGTKLLLEVLKEQNKNYEYLTKDEKIDEIKKILNANLTQILQKVNLPNLENLRWILKKEFFRNKRRRKNAKKISSARINFSLWKLILDAKQALIPEILQNDYLTKMKNENQTILNHNGISNNKNTDLDYSNYSSSTSEVKIKELSILKIMPNLEKKLLKIDEYSKFIGCIDRTFRSEKVEKLKINQVSLDEKSDFSVSDWNKIILSVNFSDKKLDNIISKWEKLRGYINQSIKNLLKQYPDAKNLKLLSKNFYIILKN